MTLFGRSDVARGCPPELELSRALSLGQTAALAEHLGACARCAAVLRTLARPGELARALPWRAPRGAAREQARTALLAAFAAERGAQARPARARRRTFLALVAPLAVAAACILAWRLAPHAHPPAPLSRTAPSTREVAPLEPGGPSSPAARQLAPPATASVHGTRVHAKVAGVRLYADAARTPAEAAFVEGWAAFRAGRFGGAINAFDDVVRLDPAGPLAEDALYWRAVALARTGARDAGPALESFARRYPRSAHAEDAARLVRSLAR